MARYTLRSYCGAKQLERYDHRGVDKLRSILIHPRNHRAGQTGPFGEDMDTADRFEILDSQMEKIFEGSVDDALNFVNTL